MILTYQFRLLPGEKQHRALEMILEAQRQLYNAALQERLDAYVKRGVTRSYMDQTKALTEWRNTDAEAYALPVSLQRETLKRLDRAYDGFYRRLERGEKPGYPRFRGKGWFDSFGFSEFDGITLRGSHLRFKSMPGMIKVHFHRPLPEGGSIRRCSFRRDPKGWTVSFSVAVPEGEARRGERAIGLDLGITTFATLSNGEIVPSVRAARKAERRLAAAHRALSRTKCKSAGRRKARILVARCHHAVARKRADYLHQASAALVRKYDVIAVEKLNVKGLSRTFLAKHVHDASWARFVSMLRYKAEKAGARLVEVDPRCTSQECSACGEYVEKALDQRLHACPRCGLRIDRDLNAALNVLHRAGVGPGLHNARKCVQAETSAEHP